MYSYLTFEFLYIDVNIEMGAIMCIWLNMTINGKFTAILLFITVYPQRQHFHHLSLIDYITMRFSTGQ